MVKQNVADNVTIRLHFNYGDNIMPGGNGKDRNDDDDDKKED